MNRPAVAVALGLAAGAAAALGARSVRPTPASLDAMHRRIHPHRSGPARGAAGTTRTGAGSDRDGDRAPAADAVGASRSHAWADRLVRTAPGRRLVDRFADDLVVAQVSAPELIVQLGVFGVVGFVTGAALAGALVASGAQVAPVLAGFGSLAFGAGAVLAAVQQLRTRAARARAHFRDAVSQYLTLCSSVMAAGRSAEWAVRYAAGAGQGRAFETIDGALSSAPAMGRTTWAALESVAAEWHVSELGDLAAAIERATTLGGDAAEAAGVIAQSMRARSLDAVDRANVAMLGPTYLFLAGFGLFLAFPLLDELSRSL